MILIAGMSGSGKFQSASDANIKAIEAVTDRLDERECFKVLEQRSHDGLRVGFTSVVFRTDDMKRLAVLEPVDGAVKVSVYRCDTPATGDDKSGWKLPQLEPDSVEHIEVVDGKGITLEAFEQRLESVLEEHLS